MKKLRELRNGVGFLTGKQVPVGIHRQRNGRMPHDRLNDLRCDPLHCQPNAASVTKAVKVERLAVMVLAGQEIAFLASRAARRRRQKIVYTLVHFRKSCGDCRHW